MGEKYGVITNPPQNTVEGNEGKTLRRKEDVAQLERCPTCDAPLLETATLVLQCPNCGTLPFER